MGFPEDQTAVILRGQASTDMKLCFSLNDQVLDLFLQHAQHEDGVHKIQSCFTIFVTEFVKQS